MSAAETYLRELRRALPLGTRRRLVAEVREHFASAADAGEAERETIERLGPARVVAAQLVADLRSGALGRTGRLTAAMTIARVAACGVVIALAAVAGALLAGRHAAPVPPMPRTTAYSSPTITLDPQTGEVTAVMHAVQGAVQPHQSVITWQPSARQYYVVTGQSLPTK
ncbi:MAG: HAAS signaling domain-containing protein [Gaiellaceae bacterium]